MSAGLYGACALLFFLGAVLSCAVGLMLLLFGMSLFASGLLGKIEKFLFPMKDQILNIHSGTMGRQLYTTLSYLPAHLMSML